MGTPMINSVTHSATWTHCVEEDYSQGCWPCGWRPESGRQIEKCRGKGKEKKTTTDEKRDVYKTPEVNEAAYLSAVSVMCKQRPFRAARHTIALFAMQ